MTFALKCTYAGLTQLSRELKSSDLDAPDLFAECSNRIGKVAPGRFVNSNATGSFGKSECHPESWMNRNCLEVEAGPWRHMQPEGALETCQSLLKRADEEPLVVVRDAGGAPDFAATFDTGEGAANTEQLAILDVARWVYSRHPREHRFAIPSFVELDVSPARWGAQEICWLKDGNCEVRLLWNALHPDHGFTVVEPRSNGATVVVALHTMPDALSVISYRLKASIEDVIRRASDSFGWPAGQFRPLVQEAREMIIEVEWRRVVTEQLVREVVSG